MIGLKEFDDKFSVESKQYTVVTGIPSSGKSEFVDSMHIGYAMKYNEKTCFISPENKPTRNHAQKLVKKLLGYAPKNANEFGMKYEKVESFIDYYFYFVDFDSGYGVFWLQNQV